MSIYINKNTRVITQGITGKQGGSYARHQAVCVGFSDPGQLIARSDRRE